MDWEAQWAWLKDRAALETFRMLGCFGAMLLLFAAIALINWLNGAT